MHTNTCCVYSTPINQQSTRTLPMGIATAGIIIYKVESKHLIKNGIKCILDKEVLAISVQPVKWLLLTYAPVSSLRQQPK